MPDPLLQVRDLSVTFRRQDGELPAVRDVTFDLAPGEVLTILGESGSGKSVTLRALMGLLPPYAAITGDVHLRGRSLLAQSRTQQTASRNALAMVFQEPMASLDPVYNIGAQIIETIIQHEAISHRAARARALELLDLVRIPSAARRMRNYPHELSGGMRQRAMIALALACSPSVLLADEPTTALDVTVQMQILLLLRQLQSDLGMAIVFVTHDMGVAAEISDRVAVMYAGRFVETGACRDVLRTPAHPYTSGLIASTVHGGRRTRRLDAIPGAPPNLADLPPGCAFAPRCTFAIDLCRRDDPPNRHPTPGRMVRCVHATIQNLTPA